MKSKLSPLCFISVLLVFASCSTPRMFTTLDLLRPADFTFAPGVKNILIVNNSAVQPYAIGHTTYGQSDSETVKFDSAALFCQASLVENLEAKAFFNSIKTVQNNPNAAARFDQITPLQKEAVISFCRLHNADAVISLDQMQTEDELGQYFAEYSLVNALDVQITTTWSIHYPNNTPSISKQFVDEFSWETTPPDPLPSRYNALVDASILTGTNIAERMIPRWEKQDRYFYTPKKSTMKQAMDSVATRNWKAAITLWEQAARQTSSKNTQFMAASNAAIASEILGDIDRALVYCETALRIYPDMIFIGFSDDYDIQSLLEYYDFLKKRKTEIELIRTQLSE